MPRAFTSIDQPPARQLRWWQEVLSDIYYNLEVISPHRDGLFGRIVEHDFGCASITEFAADSQRVLRTRSRIAMDDADSFVLVIPLRQPLFYNQSGRSGFCEPGSYVLVQTREFYELSCPDGFANVTVKLPGDRVRARIPFAEDHCARAFAPQPEMGRLLRDYAIWLLEHRAAMPDALAMQMSEQLLDLLAALLASEAGHAGASGRKAAAKLRRRIHAYLAEHLFDPDISPAKVADAFGISVTYLYQLFRPAGVPIGRWIVANRLQRGYEMLTLPRHQGHSIAEIAYTVGFNSQSHFSDAFRRQFGITPSQARQAMRGGAGMLKGRQDAAPAAFL